MFVDEAIIDVKAGNGGDGMVAFRHEKYVPNGGPAGGDGGKGGNVVLIADSGLKTLMDFKYHSHFKAERGTDGQIKSMYGRAGKDLVLKVPTGTIVRDIDNDQVLGDLVDPGQTLIVAKGGNGGRGNIHFATSRHQAPEIAENGTPGQDLKIKLELKMIADVGLVGFPSVGKSTFLSVVTSAKPKVASYAFTTLKPNLGVLKLKDGRELVIADLPGIIEGAAQGVGLGLVFLRHIERTKILLHLVDMDPNNGRDAFTDFVTIRKELASYGNKVAQKPTLIVATKIDLPGAEDKFANFKKEVQAAYPEIKQFFTLSNTTHSGVEPLVDELFKVMANLPKPTEEEIIGSKKHVDYTFVPEDTFKIIKREADQYEVVSTKINELIQKSNLEYQDGVMRLARTLRKMGVDEALRNKGAKDGDIVRIGDFELEFKE